MSSFSVQRLSLSCLQVVNFLLWPNSMMSCSNGSPGEAYKVLSDESLYSIYDTYNTVIETIPPAPAPPVPPSSVLEIGTLCAPIIASSDMLFLIAYLTPGSTTPEWSLVHFASRRSMPLHPNALQDGKFLVEFFICYPEGAFYSDG